MFCRYLRVFLRVNKWLVKNTKASVGLTKSTSSDIYSILVASILPWSLSKRMVRKEIFLYNRFFICIDGKTVCKTLGSKPLVYLNRKSGKLFWSSSLNKDLDRIQPNYPYSKSMTKSLKLWNKVSFLKYL